MCLFLIIFVVFVIFMVLNFFCVEWEMVVQVDVVEDCLRLVVVMFCLFWCSFCWIIELCIDDVCEDYEDVVVEFICFDFMLGC